ncbi:ADP-ribosylation factor-like protein 5B [Centruroides sculpturatus]|uniref:ADP-ribosylation factor-like protein 5B n=1 Tax=Centruroides sculpturatus TaxID=218467 RepID=UPI000C6D7F19|nr:ADP-ribosylation factor-like protein 5B [Centruroides sculpturatus]XP_023232476.1 ADP-ribosylation factor-like protein 5B [Centruroides sculpturatus]
MKKTLIIPLQLFCLHLIQMTFTCFFILCVFLYTLRHLNLTYLHFILMYLIVILLLTEHKIVIVGLDNAGKTTILYQFLMNEVVHTSPTIGSNVEEVVWKNVHFIMWDLGGQETLRATWNTYYSNAEFLIVVIDSMDRERLLLTKEELWKMLAHEVICFQ